MAVNEKKSKVVLFHPHHMKGSYNTNQWQPLNLLSISGFPDQMGYEIVIIDATVSKDHKQRVLEECEDALCFGTTSILGYQAYHSYMMAKEVKERYPSLPVIVGGWFPSVETEKFIRQGGADIVVIRQGELTFMELLEALRSGSSIEQIEGIAYKDGDELVFNPLRKIEDLNKMPPMPYHLINFEDYFAGDPYDRVKQMLHITTGKDFSSVDIRTLDYFSSYGCPDGCKFCTSPTLTERRWMALEAGRMVDEIDHLVKKHHFNILKFVDANWGVSEKRVLEFCEGLLRKGIDINWTAMVEAHVMNKFDEKTVELMAESGCYQLYFGGEAVTPTTIELIKKNIKPGDIFKFCETCCNNGILPATSYIIGYPDETEESIQATIEESCEVLYRWPLAEVPLVVFVPIPSTPLHARAVELGYQPPTSIEYWGEYRHIMTEIDTSFNPKKKKNNQRIRPDLYSGITPKQIKTLLQCHKYYFFWASGRLMESVKLNFLGKMLNKTSRFRLKHKLLSFPIEYKIYNGLRRLVHSLRSG